MNFLTASKKKRMLIDIEKQIISNCIDKKIVQWVRFFNRFEGIVSAYSCSGHCDEDEHFERGQGELALLLSKRAYDKLTKINKKTRKCFEFGFPDNISGKACMYIDYLGDGSSPRLVIKFHYRNRDAVLKSVYSNMCEIFHRSSFSRIHVKERWIRKEINFLKSFGYKIIKTRYK